MAEYKYVNAIGARLDIDMSEIVDGIDIQRAHLQEPGFSQALSPLPAVTVAAGGGKRRQGSEFFEDARFTNIPCMDDEITATQKLPGFRPQKTVGVGNESYAEHGLMITTLMWRQAGRQAPPESPRGLRQ